VVQVVNINTLKMTIMKTIYLTLVIALMSISTTFGQTKTEKFKVYGICSMCKTRIEKAAKTVKGVSAANWSIKTKMLTVSLDTTKTDLHKIEMAIAKAGHDTKTLRAKDEDYKALPSCCKYERKPIKKKTTKTPKL